MLAADHHLTDPQALHGPIEIAPAQAEQLGLPQPGQRRGADDHAQHRAEHVRGRGWGAARPALPERLRLADDDPVRDRADHGLELLHREELQVGVGVAGAPAPRTGRAPDGVLFRPLHVDRVLEDTVEHRQRVPHGLRREAFGDHRLAEAFDVAPGDAGDQFRAHSRADVEAVLALAVGQVALAHADVGELGPVGDACLVGGVRAGLRDPRVVLLGRLDAAELGLGLLARESKRRVLSLDPPIDVAGGRRGGARASVWGREGGEE